MVEGVAKLQPEICGLVTNAVFGVTPKLAPKTILATAFIDKEIKQIETTYRQFVPNDGDAVPIVEVFADKATIQFLNGSKTQDDGFSRMKPSICSVAKKKTIPPRSNAP